MIENRIFPNLELPKFKVAARCITFNHAPYILDALHGFVMQETNFPFLTIVIDDASTDGEQEVIEKYMKEEFSIGSNNWAECWENDLSRFIYARHPSNKECYFVVLLLKRNLYKESEKKKSLYSPWIDLCEYRAECEGDDYWTSPEKLQIQVDFLDSHPEFGLVYTQASIFKQDDGQIIGVWGRKVELQDILFADSSIPTLSVCFRKELFSEYQKSRSYEPTWVLSDVPLWLFFLYNSKVHFIPKVMGTYRVLQESASHSEDFYKRANFVYGAFKCRQFYAEKYCGRTIARKVAKIRIQNLLSLSFQFDKHHRLPLLNDLVINRIYDFKLWILVILSKYNWGRKFVNKQRNLRNYYNGKFKTADCKRY